MVINLSREQKHEIKASLSISRQYTLTVRSYFSKFPFSQSHNHFFRWWRTRVILKIMNWRTEESDRTSAINAAQLLQTGCTSVDIDAYTMRCQSVCNVISARRPLLKENTWRDTCRHNTLTRSRLCVSTLHVTKLSREKINCRITTECTQMRHHISVPFVEKPTDTGKINNCWPTLTKSYQQPIVTGKRKIVQPQIKANLLSSTT